MLIRIYSGDKTSFVEGELTLMNLGNDGLWIHLDNCTSGPRQQSFAMDHRSMIRPSEEIKDGKAITLFSEGTKIC